MLILRYFFFLRTVAHSGTFAFFDAAGNCSMDADLIGQSGLGFYSSYLVAHRIEVTPKRYNSTQNIWASLDTSSYTVGEDKYGEDLKRGTKVKLFLKEKEVQYSNTTRTRATNLTVAMKIIQIKTLVRLSRLSVMSI